MCVMMIYDAPPFGLYALKSSGIAEPGDLVGHTLGAPVFDASYKLFPAFAAQVGIDPPRCRASTWTRPCARRCWCAARST
jgi:ABC-type nitrate/sulfonate/bicarbonate transport system substrate-binding protein